MVGCRPATARKPAKLVCSLQWTCMCGRHNACYASQPMLVPKWDAHAKAKHVCARPGCAGRASVHPDSHGALLQGLRRMVDQANAGKHKPRPPIDPRPLRFGEGADGGEGSEPVERRTAVSCSVCGAGISKADNFSSHKHRACPSAEPLPAQLWRPRAGPPSRPWLRMPEPDARQQRIDQHNQHQGRLVRNGAARSEREGSYRGAHAQQSQPGVTTWSAAQTFVPSPRA